MTFIYCTRLIRGISEHKAGQVPSLCEQLFWLVLERPFLGKPREERAESPSNGGGGGRRRRKKKKSWSRRHAAPKQRGLAASRGRAGPAAISLDTPPLNPSEEKGGPQKGGFQEGGGRGSDLRRRSAAGQPASTLLAGPLAATQCRHPQRAAAALAAATRTQTPPLRRRRGCSPPPGRGRHLKAGRSASP